MLSSIPKYKKETILAKIKNWLNFKIKFKTKIFDWFFYKDYKNKMIPDQKINYI